MLKNKEEKEESKTYASEEEALAPVQLFRARPQLRPYTIIHSDLLIAPGFKPFPSPVTVVAQTTLAPSSPRLWPGESNLVFCSSPKAPSPSFSNRFSELGLDRATINQKVSILPLQYSPDNEQQLSTIYASTKLTPDFFERVLRMSNILDILMSFRLQSDPLDHSNRRYSLGNGHIVLASPKMPGTVTKTNSADTLCSGHIPRSEQFADKKYCPTDNNNPGKFPELCDAADEGLLEFLQKNESPNIIEVRLIGNLICWSEYVPYYYKKTDINKNQYYQQVNHFVIKHFIQEAESLYSIMDRIDRGIYRYIKSSTTDTLFSDKKNNVCRVDLTKLTSTQDREEINGEFTSLEALKRYIYFNGLKNSHGPIWYQKDQKKPEIYCPVMVHSGDNGFHITGDTDPEHVAVRRDMPASAHISYNSKEVSHQLFINGLIKLSHDLEDEKYSHDEYYVKTFIPMTKRALDFYINNPEELLNVGVSRIYDLIVKLEFDHPLYIHGAEDLHPGSKPEEFGAILICHNSELFITPNEKSYLAFLFHDEDILRKQIIGVHSYWLSSKREDPRLSKWWLDLLEVQALHKAEKGSNELQDYHNIVSESINKKREHDTEAIEKINIMFSDVNKIINRFNGNESMAGFPIERRLSAIYKAYASEIETIQSMIKKPEKLRMNYNA